MTATDTHQPTSSPDRDVHDFGGTETPKRRINFKTVALMVGVIALVIIAVLFTNEVKNRQAETKERKLQMSDAKNDLNNRIQTESLNGEFVRVFFVGDQMRAEWNSTDKRKRCVQAVKPPNPKKGILRYSTVDGEANANDLVLEDRNALSGVEAVRCGGIGGG
jgi:hypothetical protein